MGGKVTIKKIAELAGVSRGTVDRVLNNRSYVKEDVRERILAIVQETGYVSQREVHLREQAEHEKELRIGVLLPNRDFGSQFLSEVKQGIARAAGEMEESGVRVYVKQCETDLPAEAISLLDELKGMGAQAFSVCALNDASVSEHLLKLKGEGLPCVTFNSDLPGSGRILFVGQDIRKTGRLAAELMSKCIRPGEQILATVGNLKFDGHQQRLAGFREKLGELEFPEENLLLAETFNDYTETLSLVTDRIRQYPKLKGIYMANLSVAGCAEAIRREGKQGEIHVVCHDINPGIARLLAEGLVDFTIPQDFAYQGYEPLKCLAAYLRGSAVWRPEPQKLMVQVLCRENV